MILLNEFNSKRNRFPLSVVVFAAAVARVRVVGVVFRLPGDVELLPLRSELDHLPALVLESFATRVPPKTGLQVEHSSDYFCNQEISLSY